MQAYFKERQGLSANHSKPGERHGTHSPSQPQRELVLPTPSSGTSSLQNRDSKDLLYKLLVWDICYGNLSTLSAEPLTSLKLIGPKIFSFLNQYIHIFYLIQFD